MKPVLSLAVRATLDVLLQKSCNISVLRDTSDHGVQLLIDKQNFLSDINAPKI